MEGGARSNSVMDERQEEGRAVEEAEEGADVEGRAAEEETSGCVVPPSLLLLPPSPLPPPCTPHDRSEE